MPDNAPPCLANTRSDKQEKLEIKKLWESCDRERNKAKLECARLASRRRDAQLPAPGQITKPIICSNRCNLLGCLTAFTTGTGTCLRATESRVQTPESRLQSPDSRVGVQTPDDTQVKSLKCYK